MMFYVTKLTSDSMAYPLSFQPNCVAHFRSSSGSTVKDSGGEGQSQPATKPKDKVIDLSVFIPKWLIRSSNAKRTRARTSEAHYFFTRVETRIPRRA